MKRLVSIAFVLAAFLVVAAPASAAFEFQATTLEPLSGKSVEAVALGELDGHDGPDLVTAYAEGEAGGIAVQLNDGHGHFGAPTFYPTGCRVSQVELADVGAAPESISPDGNLDAVVTCVQSGGDSIFLERMFGNGAGGFSSPVPFVESAYGFDNGLALSHQSFALAAYRGTSGPPIPIWTYLEDLGSFHFARVFCFSYDWQTRNCTSYETAPQPYVPVVSGVIAQAIAFTGGGSQGMIAWGPASGVWTGAEADLGPTPESPDPADGIWRGIVVADLAHDGPDLIGSEGTSGIDGEPITGHIAVNYGDNEHGVPPQHATIFSTAGGVSNISSGDFNGDGNTDIVGTYHRYASGLGTGGVFFQEGNGAGSIGAPQEIPLYEGENWDTGPIRVADLDGNGTPDVVAIVGHEVRLLMNQAPPPNPSGPPTQGGGAGSQSGSKGGSGGSALAKALAGIKGLMRSTTLLPNGTVVLGTATGPTAGVTLTITYPPFKAKGNSLPLARGKGAKKPVKPVTIGTAHIAVPAGRTMPLKVKLSGKARKLLRKSAIRTTLSLSATSTGGGKESEAEPLTIKPAKKKN
ncbi:MAG TPA: VCBS repeat-containing protein [Solirubrobacterales bacterium]|nr:VCBS repeat-containing protein [Solirubrobacterales bacterium]